MPGMRSRLRKVLGGIGGHSRTEEPTSEEPPGNLRFEEVVIFYNQVFGLGSNINPTEAARKLLQEDFALAAPNYLTNEVEVAERFKYLKRLRSSAEDLSDLGRSLHSGGVRGAATWALHHPIRSLRLVPLWLRSRRNRGRSREDQNSDERTEQAERTEAAGDASEPTEERAIKFMDDAMRKLEWFESLQRHVDRGLFKPQYLGEVPFTRVGLQPFSATMAGEKIGVDVGLLLHRSGIAILTFYVSFKGQKTTQELLDLENFAPEPSISELRVARAVVEPQARSHGLRDEDLNRVPSEREFSGGVEWFVYRDHEKGSLVDVFDMYRIAVASSLRDGEATQRRKPIARPRDTGWLVYPVVFARRVLPAVPDSGVFRERYPRQIAGLVQRTRWQGLTDENVRKMAEGDLSIRKDHSLYVEAGHATVFYLEPYRQRLNAVYGGDVPGHDWLAAHFQTSAVVDVLLIQRWILTELNRQLGTLSYDPTGLNKLKRDLLIVLEEYHNIAISYGSAQEIVRQAREKMGTDDLYQALMQKLNILDRLIEVEETRRRTWRDRILKAVTAVATLLLGLPAASRVAGVVGGWDSPTTASQGPAGTLLDGLTGFVNAHPVGVSVALYLVSVCLVLPWIVLSVLPSRGRRRIVESDQSRPARDRGFVWSGNFSWKDRDLEKDARKLEDKSN